MSALNDLRLERERQDARWGEQNHDDGTGLLGSRNDANLARLITERHVELGTVSWKDVLDEEVREAFAEKKPLKLRAELIQVAAVALAWAEAIDRRGSL